MMGAGVQAQLLPLPGQQELIPSPGALTHIVSSLAMAPNPQATSGPPGGQGFANPSFDTTGQIAPTGMKPRVTATLWEDEGSLCFQVEAKGVCVARREGTHILLGSLFLEGVPTL
jgi:protein SOK2